MDLVLLTPSTFTDQLTNAFSWMLIHSLWQGLLVAMITAGCLMAANKANATLRYVIVLVNFAMLIVLCITTLVWEWDKTEANQISVNTEEAVYKTTPELASYDISAIQQFVHSCTVYFSNNAPTLVLVWFVFFVFRSVKILQGLVYLQKAKSSYIYEVPVFWQERVQYLCKKLQLDKAVSLFESGYVKIPMVIGHLRPIILIPAGLLTGLPAPQIEAILLHELAHIRRHDYVVNILQAIVETVFFFNPGLLWLSSLLRDERESCCDDIALAQTQNKSEFVQALISFKEYALENTKQAVAFPSKKNQLLARVSRILGHPSPALAPVEKRSFIAGILILCVIVATASIAQIKKPYDKATLKTKPILALAYMKADTTQVLKNSLIKKFRRIYKKKKLTNVAKLKADGTFHPFKPPHANIKTNVSNVAYEPLQDALLSVKQPAHMEEEQYKSGNAIKEQEQTKIDQEMVLKNQQQAMRDKVTVAKEREHGKSDIIQSEADKQQARHDLQQSRKEKAQAKSDRTQAVRDLQQAKIDQGCSKKDLLAITI